MNPLDPVRRMSLERIGWVLVGLATVAALAGGWFLIYLLWSDLRDEQSFIFDTVVFLCAAAMVVLTAAAGASLRFARLRAALLPIQLGLLVSAGMVALDRRGSEVDTFDDTVAVAIIAGFITALVLYFVAVLLEGSRRRGRWMSGVAFVAFLLGVSTPLLLERFEPEQLDFAAEGVVGMGSFELMSRITDDNQVSLGGGGVTYHQDGSASGAPGSPGGDLGGNVQLLADPAGRLSVRMKVQVPGDSRVPVELRSGTCHSHASERISRWTVRAGLKEELPVAGTSVGDLDPKNRLHVRWGSGAPLANVVCIDFAEPMPVLLAQEGAARFASDCLDGVTATRDERSRIRPESLEDRACAWRMRALADLAGGAVYDSAAQANEVGRCLAKLDAGGTVRRLRSRDLWAVSITPGERTNGDPWSCLIDTNPYSSGVGEPYPIAGGGVDPATGIASHTPAPYGVAVGPVGTPVPIDPVTGLPLDVATGGPVVEGTALEGYADGIQ